MSKRKKKSTRRAAASPKRAAGRGRRGASARGPVLRTTLLGAPLELIYRHAHGGTYAHKFAKGSHVSYTADGKHLVIDGSSVKAFIEG